MLKRLRRNRKYKSGTGWCFWRWTDVDSEYILRLHVLKTPWFAVCLHWINKPDPEGYLHDHPVSFLSCILRGGYTEARVSSPGYMPPLMWPMFEEEHTWFNWIRGRSSDIHTITEVKPNTLTLCFMGPKTRDWGFHTEKGWVMWKDYYAAKRAAK